MINFILGFLIGVCIAIPLVVLSKQNTIKAIKELLKENKLLYLEDSVSEFVNEMIYEFENKLKKIKPKSFFINFYNKVKRGRRMNEVLYSVLENWRFKSIVWA